ncbi:hypothetical protein XU18_2945 [Perkinsela sp. CCAP 1560/4]|nr:hypothetical protein XU18_2945 [Perkinsela sp. CCAP 1560/4]|eukprot:KNH06189.1 hypothetical protein XU18_2945 [Perkinsela sp. CCAP 1560/4]
MYRLISLCGCIDSDKENSQEFTNLANNMTVEAFLALPSDYHRHLVTAYSHTVFRQSLSAKVDLDRMNINKASIFLQESEIGVSTMANRDIQEGERILTLRGPLTSKANVFTIQVDHDRHVIPCGGCEYLAHSCQPNVKLVIEKNKDAASQESKIAFDAEKSLPDLLETQALPEWWNEDTAPGHGDSNSDEPAFAFQDKYALHVVAIKDIKKGDVVSFNYLTTEYDMDAPFNCRCAGGDVAENEGEVLPKCFGDIQGFKHLKHSVKEALKPLCTSIVLECEEQSQE